MRHEHAVRIGRVQRDVHRHAQAVYGFPGFARVIAAQQALGGGGVHGGWAKRVELDVLHPAQVAVGPIEAFFPRRAAVFGFQNADAIGAACGADGDVGGRVFQIIHLARARVQHLRVGGVNGQRAHAQHREARLHPLPSLRAAPGGVAAPDAARRAARPHQVRVLRVQGDAERAPADVFRADGFPHGATAQLGFEAHLGHRLLVFFSVKTPVGESAGHGPPAESGSGFGGFFAFLLTC